MKTFLTPGTWCGLWRWLHRRFRHDKAPGSQRGHRDIWAWAEPVERSFEGHRSCGATASGILQIRGR